jgi:phosphoserine phosphatase RsbU/P
VTVDNASQRRQLRASEAAEFEDLFENAPCGYIRADPRGTILRANRTLATWLDTDPSALVGKRFHDLLSIGSRLYYETHFAPMLRMSGGISEVALDLSSAKTRRLPVIVNATERRDDSGTPREIWIVLFTARERRRYERNLLDAKATAEEKAKVERAAGELREQLIAILGHDLRNPVAAISGGLRILKREPLSERAHKVIALMEGSTVRASVLISNVLDFARERLGGSIPLTLDRDRPLAPVIEQVVAELRLVAPDRKIIAEIDLPDPVPVDHSRLGQLASNLLSNALTHGAADQPVRLNACCAGGMFELSVANGGEPIDEDTRANLFRPFYRGAPDSGAETNKRGLGLGLHIASEIAKAHGGTLDVESSEAETRFTFRMPLDRGESGG